MHLTDNMRVRKANDNVEMGKAFENYLLKIGSGKDCVTSTNGAKQIKIAADLCVWNQEELIDFVFPSLKNETTVEADHFDRRAILSTCNETIDNLNDIMIEKLKIKMNLKTHHTYFSSDSIKEEHC